MTVVFEIAGHEEWLRLRQVCRLFDDASYSMVKVWPLNAQQTVDLMLQEERDMLASDGLQELIESMERDIQTKVNKVVAHRDMKDRIISFVMERKTCFVVQRRWKPGDQVKSVAHIAKLQNVGVTHPIGHLQLLVICLIFTKQIPEAYRRLKAKALVANLGGIIGQQALTTIARRIASAEATVDSHILSLTNIEGAQLDDLFAPVDPQRIFINSQNNEALAPNRQPGMAAMTSSLKSTSPSVVQVPFEVLDDQVFARTRGMQQLYGAMKALYDNLNLVRANPQVRRLRLLRLEREEKERALAFLSHITTQGVQSKKLFKRRTDQEDAFAVQKQSS